MRFQWMLLLAVVCCTESFAQKINFSIDFRSAYLTLEMLEADCLEPKTLHAFFSLSSTPKMLEKLGIDSATLVSALIKVKKGESLDEEEARLDFEPIRQQLDTARAFLKTVETQKAMLEQYLQDSLSRYFPEKKTIHIRMLFGGNNGGFTFKSSDEFFIALHKMEYDYTVLLSYLEHELFHNAQHASFDVNPVADSLLKLGLQANVNVLIMLTYLWQEGSATYISRPEKYEQTPALLKAYEHHQKNRERLYAAFYIFERLTLDSRRDPAFNIKLVRGVFFSMTWDELGYFIGAEMLKALLAPLDEAARHAKMQQYLKSPPTRFVLDYIALSRQEDKQYFQFSQAFEHMTTELDLLFKAFN